jgi:hypothetical protein
MMRGKTMFFKVRGHYIASKYILGRIYQTVSIKITQLGTLDHLKERNNPFVFQGPRPKIKFIASLRV